MDRSITLLLKAGPHARCDTPLLVELGDAAKGQSEARLTELGANREIPCQLDGRGLAFILPGMGENEERKVLVEFGEEGAKPPGVRFCDSKENGLAIEIGGEPFTVYRYLPRGEVPISARPFFYPLFGPGGVSMTRHYPMKSGVPGETNDHPHHRGLYVAFGDVNGTDNWSEEKGHGFQTHQRFLEMTSGPVFGRFTEVLAWESSVHHKVCEEIRKVTVWNLPRDGRMLDLAVTFEAGSVPVRFGDTKEGGIVSIRVPTTMDADKGGAIENSAGGIGEAETWGKSAHWVDYHGPSQGQHVGIAILDHPFNLRHPTAWHVRNYGLFTANPFGLGHYKSGLLQKGDFVLGANASLVFRYRLYFHRGDTRRGDVAGKWSDYAFPPAARKAE